ncbi:S1C family serine protease [Altericista sp. CCNU0014]|uniref:S1C family serine protease n=1 Tax=Altericista sp. CCNU0014 TaxID=3082949 RepID=UPI003850BBCD
MVNSRGEAIGVNTAIVQAAQGISFAIPINTARWVIPELMRSGRVRRGRIGVAGQTVPLPHTLVRQHGLSRDRGVLVLWLEPNSPAQIANLKPRDVLVELAGQPLSTVDDLHRNLTAERIGQPLPVKLLRRGELLEISIVPLESSYD